MKKTYFIAVGMLAKPFINWNSVGSFTLSEFAASPFADNRLVLPENELPAYAFGVSTVKIEAGELVARSAPEMAIFQAEHNVRVGLNSEALRIGTINASSFTYDSNDFPMDEVSRLFYLAIEKNTPASAKLRTMANVAYMLESADIAAFMTAYYAALLLISKHTI